MPANIAVHAESSGARSDFVRDMNAAVDTAADCLRRVQERMRRYANRRQYRKRRELSFEVGEFVFLDGKNLHLKFDGAKKLMHRFLGPFEIVKKIGKVVYELKLPANMLIHDVFHVSLLRPYKKGGGLANYPPASPSDTISRTISPR